MKTFNWCVIANVPPAEAGTPNPAYLARLEVRDSAGHEGWGPAFRRSARPNRLKAGLQTSCLAESLTCNLARQAGFGVPASAGGTFAMTHELKVFMRPSILAPCRLKAGLQTAPGSWRQCASSIVSGLFTRAPYRKVVRAARGVHPPTI